MSWRHEDLLWLLGIVPAAALALIAGWTLRRRASKRFGAEASVRGLLVGRATAFWRSTRAVLLVIGLGLLVLTLAGPQYGSRSRVLHKRGVDVVVVLDFSKSMLARDVRPTRIDRAKAELGRFVQELDGDRVGVVAFAGETIEFPMTVDYAAVDLFLRDLGPYDMPVGGTAIGRALMAAQRLLERSRPTVPRTGATTETSPTETPSRVVILMTDGEDHEGDPLAAADELATAGTRIYTVGIGTRTPEAIPTFSNDGTWTGYLLDDAGNPVTTSLTADNERVLQQVADRTGGKYFRAGRGNVGVDQIRAEMRRMRQEERRMRRVTVHEERYALVLLPAFLLVLLEGLLPEAWIRRRKGVG